MNITDTFEPISIVCDEDPEERHFDSLIKLWVEGDIPYNVLMRNYPAHDETNFLKKILNYIIERI